MKRHTSLIVLLGILLSLTPAQAWWNKEWTLRKKLTVDTGTEAGNITEPIGSSVVLLRLHDGNFQFANAKDGGTDIRFVSEDDKTELPYHVEKYDGLLNEAFVWVKVPDVKPSGQTSIWMYYGNPEDAAPAKESKATFDADVVANYHFTENAAPPVDASPQGNNAETAGQQSAGAMIGSGLRLDGQTSVTIPVSPSLAWTAGAPFSWSAWIKPALLQPNAEILSRQEGGNAVVIGLDNGVPFVSIKNGGTTQRSAPGAPLAVGIWRHLAVVADGTKTSLFVDGEPYASVDAALPAMNSPLFIGGEGTGGSTRFAGEMDEMNLSRVARPLGNIQLAALGQSGSDRGSKLVVLGEDEGEAHGGENEMLEHLSLFGDIANNMMFDGWVVIFVCIIMVIVGWAVAIQKFLYLNGIQKGGEEFLKQWATVATDLTAIDHRDSESVSSLGGSASPKIRKLMKASPLYHIYHIGSEEIRHRLDNSKVGFTGLSGRSIQAIRASLEAGLTREVQRLNSKLVFLTISIAGGPYVGLLGTVMGVMITFAVIAKSGEVEVNSIAPGIASALLATVAGLVVAIPALFIYSYLNARIKDTITTMHLFIDEFVTKMAEFYPDQKNQGGDASKGH